MNRAHGILWACLIRPKTKHKAEMLRLRCVSHPQVTSVTLTGDSGLVEQVDRVFTKPDVITPTQIGGLDAFLSETQAGALGKAVLWFEALSADGSPGHTTTLERLKTLRDAKHTPSTGDFR